MDSPCLGSEKHLRLEPMCLAYALKLAESLSTVNRESEKFIRHRKVREIVDDDWVVADANEDVSPRAHVAGHADVISSFCWVWCAELQHAGLVGSTDV